MFKRNYEYATIPYLVICIVKSTLGLNLTRKRKHSNLRLSGISYSSLRLLTHLIEFFLKAIHFNIRKHALSSLGCS